MTSGRNTSVKMTSLLYLWRWSKRAGKNKESLAYCFDPVLEGECLGRDYVTSPEEFWILHQFNGHVISRCAIRHYHVTQSRNTFIYRTHPICNVWFGYIWQLLWTLIKYSQAKRKALKRICIANFESKSYLSFHTFWRKHRHQHNPCIEKRISQHGSFAD